MARRLRGNARAARQGPNPKCPVSTEGLFTSAKLYVLPPPHRDSPRRRGRPSPRSAEALVARASETRRPPLTSRLRRRPCPFRSSRPGPPSSRRSVVSGDPDSGERRRPPPHLGRTPQAPPPCPGRSADPSAASPCLSGCRREREKPTEAVAFSNPRPPRDLPCRVGGRNHSWVVES